MERLFYRVSFIEQLEVRCLLAATLHPGPSNTGLAGRVPPPLMTPGVLGAGALIPAAVAEVLARGVAYEDLAAGTAVTFDGSPLPYTVDKVFADPASGFEAYGLTSTTYGPLLLSRGTEPTKLSDLIADADPRGIGYGQFSRNWLAVKAWLGSEHSAIDFIGHSLGGALTQWFASAWSTAPNDGIEPVDQVYTFESPGISDNRTRNPGLITYASSFDNSRVRSVTHYIVLGDLVVMAGEKFIKGDVITASFKDLNLAHKHTLPLLNASIGTSMRPAAITFGAMTSDQLSAPSYVHNDQDYFTIVMALQIVANGISYVTKDPSYARIPVLLMRRDTVEMSRAAIGRFLGAAQNKFTISLNGSSQAVLNLQLLPAMFTSTTFIFDRNITVTLTGNPNKLQFNGGMSLSLASTLTLNLPSIVGGPVSVTSLLNLGTLDVNGVIDSNSMRVSGQLSLLNSVGTINGTATFDWSKSTITVSGSTNFLNGFITTTGATTLSDGTKINSSGDATVSIPRGVRFIGGRTLASGHFVLSFDADNIGSSYIEGTGNSGVLSGVGLRVYFNGTFSILGINPFSIFSLPGDGASFNVPPGEQFLLMQASWDNPSDSTQIQITTPDGQTLTEVDIAANPNMQIVPDLTDSTHRTVYIATPDAGLWNVQVIDPTGLGNITYDGGGATGTVGASFQSVTGGAHRQPVQIVLNVNDPTQTSTVSLYFDSDGAGTDATPIAENLVPDSTGVVDYTWDVTSVPTGNAFVYAVVTPAASASVTVYAPSPVDITNALPNLTDAEFTFDLSQSITLSFDQDVSQSIAIDAFSLTNLTTGQVIPTSDLALVYDASTDTATITDTAGTLPDGNYRLGAATAITDADDDPLSADVAFDFFVLAGDVNRDRHLDASDLSIFSANLGNYGTFVDGDLNYDGFVDGADLAIFDANAQAWLPPQGALALPTTTGNDAYALRNESPTFFDVFTGTSTTGTPTYRVFVGAVTTLSINGDAGDDTLVLDYGNGAPFPPGGLTFDGGPGLNTLSILGTPNAADSATFAASSISINGATAVAYSNVQTLTFDGLGGFDAVGITGGNQVVFPSAQHFDSLSVAAGASAAMIEGANSLLVTRSLSLDAGAMLDLADNDMMLTYSGASPLAIVQSLINSARAGGSWSGDGLSSSAAKVASPAVTTLGAIEAGDYQDLGASHGSFDGEAITGPAVLIKYTYYGDANFDGKVNFDDYARLDAGFNGAKSGWLNGDFNGDGKVNFDDYALIDAAFNGQGAAL